MNSVRRFPKQVGKSMIALIQGQPVVIIPDAPSLEPRYGYGNPAHSALHELIDQGRDRYRTLLEQVQDLADPLAAIPYRRDSNVSPETPCWQNRWLPGLDSAALYAMLVVNRPRRFIEIGSGNSTMFARRAIQDHGLNTVLTSIDPQPREAIDAICDVVHRVPVQELPLSLFDELEAGDILFVDSSHRVFTNSDVTVIFMDILPRLKPGVCVHFHDIWLPDDYQPAWSDRYYAEQYMLATLLLFGDRFEILLPNHFITHDAALTGVLEPLWSRPELGDVRRDGASFWIRRT